MAGLRQLKWMAGIIITASFLYHQPAEASNTIRFASVGWSGVTVKTELAIHLLDSLGYSATNTMAPLPMVYRALATNHADIFLGNWMPSMQTIAEGYFREGSVTQLAVNMSGAQYTLAAPAYVVEGGLRDFRDIARFKERLEFKIYGLEEGNDGNEVILSMIETNRFGLKNFRLVTSSEAGMLAHVKSAMEKGRWIIFLGWSPHHMNESLPIKYLTGSTRETFGENNGRSTIYTNIRREFKQENPNVTRLLENLTFPVSMMNQIIEILHHNGDLSPGEAGLNWLIKHPQIYKAWLKGVRTADGAPALPAFERYLETSAKSAGAKENPPETGGFHDDHAIKFSAPRGCRSTGVNSSGGVFIPRCT